MEDVLRVLQTPLSSFLGSHVLISAVLPREFDSTIHAAYQVMGMPVVAGIHLPETWWMLTLGR